MAATAKIVYDYWKLREPLRAKTTETRMMQLMNVLDAEQPDHVDPESLKPLLAKYNRSECLTDAWGRAFLIERKGSEAGGRYEVTSLGRDGIRGSCCKSWTANWDDDAVLLGDQWLQVWHPKGLEPATNRFPVHETTQAAPRR